MKCLRIFPEMCARQPRAAVFSSSTRNIAFGSGSTTVASTSIASSFATNSPSVLASPATPPLRATPSTLAPSSVTATENSKWADSEPSRGPRRPAVGVDLHAGAAGVDHRLDRQHQPRLEPRAATRRCRSSAPAGPRAARCRSRGRRTPARPRSRRPRRAPAPRGRCRTGGRPAAPARTARSSASRVTSSRLRASPATSPTAKVARRVTVVALEQHPTVDTDDVALVELASRRDPVDDHVVDRGAQRRRDSPGS